MKPTPLRTSQDLIDLLVNHAPSKACERSMRKGNYIVLGGFAPAGCLPRIVVRVRSDHGRIWFVALVIDEATYRFLIEYPDTVEWKDWAGVEQRRHPVWDGDTPDQFCVLKEREVVAYATKATKNR